MSDEQKPEQPKPESISGVNVVLGKQTIGRDLIINYGVLTQTTGAADPDRQQLQTLLKELEAALQQTPADKREDVEAVQALANTAAAEAAKPQPNKATLKITGEGLKAAAQNLLAVTPIVIQIATQIADVLGKIGH